MARYWSDGYKSTEQVGSPAETTVTMVDRVRWDNKQDPLVFDDHPVLGSGSPVTSDGIARAMLQLQDFVKQKDVELCYIDVVTQDDEAVLRDKTYIDIRDAYNNGKTLILRFVDSDDKCAYFYDFQGNVFRFVMFEVTDVLNMYTYWISPDDLLHTEQYSAPYKRPNPEVLSITYGDTSVKYDGSKHASVNIPKVPAWALGDTKPKYDASEVGAETKGVAASRVNAHNNSDTAHADIRNLIANAVNMFNMYATTAQLNSVAQTVRGYASAVQTLRQDAVLHTEVVDDMYTNNSRMPLSAKQGMLLRTMYDALKPVHVGVTMWNGNNVDTIPYYSTVPLANAVPCTDGGGRLSTNVPVDALHCANKKYVDDAILSSVVITEKAEGQIPVITDCAAVPPINIKLFGKGKQNQYEGNQLFDISKFVSGASAINNGDGSITLTVYAPNINTNKISNVLPTIKVGDKIIFSRIVYFGGSYRAAKTPLVVTQEMLDNNKFGFYANNDTSAEKPLTIKDIMFNLGDTLLPYEPFANGEPVPNMNFLQKIECLGESGSIGGKVLCENILDKNTFIDNGFTEVGENEYFVNNGNLVYDKVIFKNSYGIQGRIRLTFLVKWVHESYFGVFPKIFYTDGTVVEPSMSISTLNEYLEVDFVSNGEKVVDYIAWSYGTGSSETYIKNMQISLVESEEFKPYTEQPFTALTPNGLKGIPLGQTIPDVIKNSPIHMNGVYWDSVEKQYYIADTKNENGKDVQRIAEYVVDGNATVLAYDVGGSYSGFAIHYILPNLMDRREGYCNKLRVFTSLNKEKDAMWLGVGNNVVYAPNNSFFDASLDDYGLANFKAHLNENPLIIWTWLDEPIVTETDVQYDVVMNYPNTTIVNDEGAYMEVEYVADPKLFITNNYVDKVQHDALAARVLVLEQHVINS